MYANFKVENIDVSKIVVLLIHVLELRNSTSKLNSPGTHEYLIIFNFGDMQSKPTYQIMIKCICLLK